MTDFKNKNSKMNSYGSGSSPREVDQLAHNVQSWWGKTFVFVKTTKVKTWQGVFAIAFVGGLLTAIIWMASLRIQTSSDAAGQTASLSLRASKTADLHIDDVFDVDVALNSNGNSIVAVKAVVEYDNQSLKLVGINTLNGVFGVDKCPNDSSLASLCAIVNDDPSAGNVALTVGKPTPGVNGASIVVATLTFKALQVTTPSAANVRLSLSSSGGYDDSDVVLDDGEGTDILTSINNLKVNVSPFACASFTYSDWGACQPGNIQTRTIASASPAGCAGGSPVLSQSCVYTPPTCESFTYSDWGDCQSNGEQIRSVTSSSPAGCAGGAPALSQKCEYESPVCESFAYSDWGVCQPDGTQSRSVASSTPAGCAGGDPFITQNCTYGGSETLCSDFTYNEWQSCQPGNIQTRTIASASPAGCAGGSPVLSQSCVYTPPTCESFTYSDWGDCQSNGEQIRSVTSSSPAGCAGGAPALSQKCEYKPSVCSGFVYSNWSECQPSGTQSRSVISSSPVGCSGGGPLLSQACNYSSAAKSSSVCESFAYSDWGVCQPDGTQSRSVASSTPAGCAGGSPVLSQSCAYVASVTQPASSSSDSSLEKKKKSSSSKKSKKKKKKSSAGPTIKNSPSAINRGATLMQWGSKFSKGGLVKMYFLRPEGGYYPSVNIRANSQGSFVLHYRVTKPAGVYHWYAVDTVTGKKTETVKYKVK